MADEKEAPTDEKEAPKVEPVKEEPKVLTPFEESVREMEKARAGRNIDDISLEDPYWKICNDHRLKFNQ